MSELGKLSNNLCTDFLFINQQTTYFYFYFYFSGETVFVDDETMQKCKRILNILWVCSVSVVAS